MIKNMLIYYFTALLYFLIKDKCDESNISAYIYLIFYVI